MSGHRKTRRIYEKALTFENMFDAWHTVAHTCQNKRGLYEFSLFAHARVFRLLKILRERRYEPNRYRCFMIFEPKPRLVMSQSVNDKVINHFVAKQYLIPILERTLIETNVATRKDKGAKAAMKMIKRYVAEMQAEKPGAPIYALKVDMAKFFYSIDHEKLFEMLEKKIKDSDVIELLRRIVDETDKPYINEVIDGYNKRYGTCVPHYELGKGLSIGAMTSQFLAIFYLSDLDRTLKEREKCKYYLRYMDDLVIFGHDKKELKRLLEVVTEEAHELKLEINPKSAIYNCSSKTGVPFLGYKYHIDEKGRLKVTALSKTARRIKKRLKNLKKHAPDKYVRSRAAYKGYFMNETKVKRGWGKDF